MASTLFISEFANASSLVGTAPSPYLPQPAVTDQAVSFSGGAAASNAFNAKTHAVLLVADSSCSILFSSTGTLATTSNVLLAANTPMIFAVPPGYFVSAITNS